MASPLSIASICRDLPGPDNSSGGIFVLRRLAAMARFATVRTIQPVPWFPLVAPLPTWASAPEHEAGGLSIQHAPMFYVPKFLKFLDGMWLYRAIQNDLSALNMLHGLDAVDAHFGYPEGVGAFRAARKIGVPIFVTLRGFEAEYIHKPIIGEQIKHLIRNADGCICVSDFLKNLALEHGAVPEKTTVIHNAIDKSLFFPADKAVARTKLGLPTSAPIVISVGHLISRKRHHVLLTAFAEVLKKWADARLLIVGGKSFEPDYPNQLRDQVMRLGIGESTEFLGNVDADRVAEYLRAADVFALGTQREGCCNAVLEALACGLPVVTTPVGDNTVFVDDGDNGYIVPVDDVAALARALLVALDRRDWDRNHISAQLGVGDWDRVAVEVLAFFERRIAEISAG